MTRFSIAAVACTLLLGACSKEPESAGPSEGAEPSAAVAEPAAHPHEHPTTTAAAITAELPPVPEGASVRFVEPKDGAKLVGPLENGKVTVPVKMGAQGIAIKPAGAIEAGSGHHHVLIDVPDGVAAGTVVPADERHVHFGQGQTEADLALTPGAHTLTLQFADGIHRSYGPALSSAIAVEVAATGTVAAADTATAPND